MHTATAIPLADSWGMHGGDVGVGWMIVMALFWAAVILSVVWLLRGAARGWSTPEDRPVPTESPAQILDRRFAEGAISVEDYRARREVLTNGSAGGPSDASMTGSRESEASP